MSDPQPAPEAPTASVQCPGNCPDDCWACSTGLWELACDDCRSYMAELAEPAEQGGANRG